MAITTYSALTEQQKTFYEKVLLARALPNMVHVKLGQLGRSIGLPEKEGHTINFRKFAALNDATTPLSEGHPPVPEEISVSSTTATVKQYGSFVRYSDLLDRMAIDPVATEIAELLGEQAGNTLDVLTREVMVAGGTVQYASTAAARTDVTPGMHLTATELMTALATLESNNARPVDGGRYVAIVHPKAKFDLMRDGAFMEMFLHIESEGDSNPLKTYKFGTALGVDFYVSSNSKVWATGGASSKPVYATMVIGKHAFGVGGLGADASWSFPGPDQDDPGTDKKISPIQLMYVDPDTPSKSDPLAQQGSIGWKTTFVAKVLDDNFMVRLEHGSSLDS